MCQLAESGFAGFLIPMLHRGLKDLQDSSCETTYNTNGPKWSDYGHCTPPRFRGLAGY